MTRSVITLDWTRRPLRVAVIGVVAVLSACAVPGAEPGVSSTVRATAVSTSDARQELAELMVAPPGSMSGYSREKFPHWHTVEGTCNTREEVLKRDGTNVQVGADCAPTSGWWTSPYDGATWTKPSDVDIDHVVPLAQAWASGASSWPQDRREEFANDLTRPQLKAVTDNVNSDKSDQSPDEWKPPVASYWCTYATDWITVKHYYQLTVTQPERTALSDMLARC